MPKKAALDLGGPPGSERSSRIVVAELWILEPLRIARNPPIHQGDSFPKRMRIVQRQPLSWATSYRKDTASPVADHMIAPVFQPGEKQYPLTLARRVPVTHRSALPDVLIHVH